MASSQPAMQKTTSNNQPEGSQVQVNATELTSGEKMTQEIKRLEQAIQAATYPPINPPLDEARWPASDVVLDLRKGKLVRDILNPERLIFVFRSLPATAQAAFKSPRFAALAELTIEVDCSPRTRRDDFNQQDEHSLDSVERPRVSDKWLHVQMHTAEEYTRLHKLPANLLAYELKGKLIRLYLCQIPAFIHLLQNTVLTRVDPASGFRPWTLGMTTLSLALTDPLEAACGFDWQPLLTLEGMFPRLEHLFITSGLYFTVPGLFEALTRSIGNNRTGGPLRTLDINITDKTRTYSGAHLVKLVPQLTHLGLFYREELTAVLIGNATPGRLISLKTYCLFWDNASTDGGEVWVRRSARIFEGLISLALCSDLIMQEMFALLPHCHRLQSLKLYHNSETAYTLFVRPYFCLLIPVRSSLQSLTLINYDFVGNFPSHHSAHNNLPQLTVLNVHSARLPLLKQFRQPEPVRRLTPDEWRLPLMVRLEDVPSFANFLAYQFPALKKLTLDGKVVDPVLVQRQVIQQLMTGSGQSPIRLTGVRLWLSHYSESEPVYDIY